MTNTSYNRIKKEIEIIAQEKIANMSNEKIEELAMTYKKQEIKNCCFFTILSVVLFTAFFCYLFYSYKGEHVPLGLLIPFIVVAICVITLFPVLTFISLKKDIKTLALKKLKQESKQAAIESINQKEVSSVDNNFIISKTIPLATDSWTPEKLLIDDKNKQFIYQFGENFSKTFLFSDIISYDVYENGVSKVQGRVGSALIGAAFFGIGGLIIGSNMSRKIKETCTELKLIVHLSNLDCPQLVLRFAHNVNWDKSSAVYQNACAHLHRVCSIFEYMINSKTLEESSATVKKVKNEKSNKEKLQELKELFDEGLITEEEFTSAKKQILGL